MRHPAARHKVHLVTAHMEARCERLTSVGNPDHMLLEGDVQLICYRNGQTLRIQGQRVHVYLSDGTFTVESMPESPKQAAASRVHVPAPTGTYHQVQPATYPAPWEMVRPVRPVNGTWEYESAFPLSPFKPDE